MVPRDAYYARPDLQFVGRTLLGKTPARRQEMCDHYMAPLTSSTAVLQCMQAIQEECYKIGIPLKPRHREVCVVGRQVGVADPLLVHVERSAS